MEFEEKLRVLAEKAHKQGDLLDTEEATKTALVMPFISNILGYDVFNPLEVVPEFTADVGTKKGEKIDYAIQENDTIRILIECKKSNAHLDTSHASQLFRYFSTTDARIAILTNGKIYQFYTDLDKKNRMDEKPFLELDLRDIDETTLPELRRLTKEDFDLDSVLNAAEELKYVGQIKRQLTLQFYEPDPEWIRFFAIRVYDGQFTHRAREQFTPIVNKAMKQFLNDQVNDRLKSALGNEDDFWSENTPEPVEESNDGKTEEGAEDHKGFSTTIDELEGYRIVKAIVCSEVEPGRVTKRNSKSYFSVLLDDNNRKPIARFHFHTKHKRLGVLDSQKVEKRIPIDALEDIYSHAQALRETISHYE